MLDDGLDRAAQPVWIGRGALHHENRDELVRGIDPDDRRGNGDRASDEPSRLMAKARRIRNGANRLILTCPSALRRSSDRGTPSPLWTSSASPAWAGSCQCPSGSVLDRAMVSARRGRIAAAGRNDTRVQWARAALQAPATVGFGIRR